MVEIGLDQSECLVDPQPGAPQHDDEPVEPMTLAILPGCA